VLWLTNVDKELKPVDLLEAGVIILVVGFALFVIYKRVIAAHRGEPAEDELSKKVMQKTAALSFYISLYSWLALAFFSDRLKMEIHSVIGIGIMGMALIFAICWIVLNFRGIRNE
jgi:peptidoglycan/LPS O-acetylase OafA/YrhL